MDDLKEAQYQFKARQFDRAISAGQKVLKDAPDNADSLTIIGLSLEQQGKLDEAFHYLKQAVATEPDNVAYLINLAGLFETNNELEQAQGIAEHVINLAPEFDKAYSLLGVISLKQAHLSLAQGYFEKAKSLAPQAISNPINLALIAEMNGDKKAAAKQYEQVLCTNPDNVVCMTNLAKLKAEDSLDLAQSLLERAVKIDCEFADAQYNLSLILLKKGLFAEGWFRYQYRFKSHSGKMYFTVDDRPSVMPSEYASGLGIKHSILICSDQGLGDELFFLRYINRLKRKSNKIFYRASAKLLPLLAHANLDAQFVKGEPHPDFDYLALAGELPLLTDMKSVDDILPAIPFSVPDNVNIEIAKRLAHFPKPWIGITWEAGTVDDTRSLHKKVPDEAFFQSLPTTKGTYFILQRNPKQEALTKLSSIVTDTLVDVSHLNDDLVKMAALLSKLDHIVGVSNTNIHIAAGFKTPASILHPRTSDFRWMDEGDYSPWFPDYKIYRETKEGWSSALERLKQDLAQLFSL